MYHVFLETAPFHSPLQICLVTALGGSLSTEDEVIQSACRRSVPNGVHSHSRISRGSIGTGNQPVARVAAIFVQEVSSMTDTDRVTVLCTCRERRETSAPGEMTEKENPLRVGRG